MNQIDVIIIFFFLLYAFMNLFLYSECGERVTNQFNEFIEQLCECDWHLYSIKVQRMFIIALSANMRLANIEGYANTVCTRELFKQAKIHSIYSRTLFVVLSFYLWYFQTTNAGFSYFMMVHNMAK